MATKDIKETTIAFKDAIKKYFDSLMNDSNTLQQFVDKVKKDRVKLTQTIENEKIKIEIEVLDDDDNLLIIKKDQNGNEKVYAQQYNKEEQEVCNSTKNYNNCNLIGLTEEFLKRLNEKIPLTTTRKYNEAEISMQINHSINKKLVVVNKHGKYKHYYYRMIIKDEDEKDENYTVCVENYGGVVYRDNDVFPKAKLPELPENDKNNSNDKNNKTNHFNDNKQKIIDILKNYLNDDTSNINNNDNNDNNTTKIEKFQKKIINYLKKNRINMDTFIKIVDTDGYIIYDDDKNNEKPDYYLMLRCTADTLLSNYNFFYTSFDVIEKNNGELKTTSLFKFTNYYNFQTQLYKLLDLSESTMNSYKSKKLYEKLQNNIVIIENKKIHIINNIYHYTKFNNKSEKTDVIAVHTSNNEVYTLFNLKSAEKNPNSSSNENSSGGKRIKQSFKKKPKQLSSPNIKKSKKKKQKKPKKYF